MTALEKINNLIGMENFKKQINLMDKQIEHEIKYQIQYVKAKFAGFKVFIGNAHNGKKTAAKLFAEYLQEKGIIKNGYIIVAASNDFIGEYIGQSQAKTKDLLLKALDGVLYIDEASSLLQNERTSFIEREIMDTILSFMYDNYERICVILSDSSLNIKKLLENTIGLNTKITNYFDFEEHNG